MFGSFLLACLAEAGEAEALEFEVVMGTASSTIATPLLRWSKDRDSTTSHRLSNVLIGHTAHMRSDLNSSEATCGTTPSITADDITFNFGDDSTATHTSPNTAGSINSETKAHDWFSIVKYTGTGVNATVGHGLPVTPKWIIPKNRIDTVSWLMYTETTGPTKYMALDLDVGGSTLASAWNNTAPTSSVFSIGTNGTVNGSGDGMIALCFADKAGVCKIGEVDITSGTMSGDTDLGLAPKLFIVKRTSTTGDHEMINNETTNFLEASTANTEATNGADRVTITSETISNNGLPDGTYTYLAIA